MIGSKLSIAKRKIKELNNKYSVGKEIENKVNGVVDDNFMEDLSTLIIKKHELNDRVTNENSEIPSKLSLQSTDTTCSEKPFSVSRSPTLISDKLSKPKEDTCKDLHHINRNLFEYHTALNNSIENTSEQEIKETRHTIQYKNGGNDSFESVSEECMSSSPVGMSDQFTSNFLVSQANDNEAKLDACNINIHKSESSVGSCVTEHSDTENSVNQVSKIIKSVPRNVKYSQLDLSENECVSNFECNKVSPKSEVEEMRKGSEIMQETKVLKYEEYSFSDSTALGCIKMVNSLSSKNKRSSKLPLHSIKYETKSTQSGETKSTQSGKLCNLNNEIIEIALNSKNIKVKSLTPEKHFAKNKTTKNKVKSKKTFQRNNSCSVGTQTRFRQLVKSVKYPRVIVAENKPTVKAAKLFIYTEIQDLIKPTDILAQLKSYSGECSPVKVAVNEILQEQVNSIHKFIEGHHKIYMAYCKTVHNLNNDCKFET